METEDARSRPRYWLFVVYPSSSLDRIEHRFLMMNMPGKVGRRGDVFARKGVLSAWGTPYTALSKNKEEVAKMTQ